MFKCSIPNVRISRRALAPGSGRSETSEPDASAFRLISLKSRYALSAQNEPFGNSYVASESSCIVALYPGAVGGM